MKTTYPFLTKKILNSRKNNNKRTVILYID